MAVSQKNFDEAVKILTKKLDAVIRSQKDINKSIQSLTGEIATLKKDASDRDIKIGQLEKELEDQKLRCDQLEDQVLESDVKDRKVNLLIHGMPTEWPSQTVEENVKFFLSVTMEISDPIQITKCYRMLGVGKLLEGTGNSLKAIVEHLIVNKLKLHDQHGFHPSQSIDKDPIDTFDYVTKLIDLGSSIDMILLDLTKVSDKYATGD
ncbi:hypothetical protein QYM36_007858 [Artemia franciscana]|uniref:Uncharacterized protein n=1 Tax=Artemia franciscana TaxID=6661 RepID=A0AA88LE45_ARTSF|nr:hypothetical protein QYM36_007858 [Artemia franciscana]